MGPAESASVRSATDARPSLFELELTGTRATVRAIWTWTMAGATIATAVGYTLPAYRYRVDKTFRSYLDDGPSSPLFVLPIALVLLIAKRRGTLGRAMRSGMLCFFAAMLATLGSSCEHMFYKPVAYASGEAVYWSGSTALALGGILMFVGAPFLYVLERRARGRALARA
jgi:hypothetical protein